MTKKKTRSSRGFTLLEVLIAVLIVGIIATAAIPLLSDYTEQAREARMAANVQALDRAVQRYELDHQAPWGFVYEPLSEDLYIPYNWEGGLGFVEQLEEPTDAYGNVLGDPGSSVTGPCVHGPYVSDAFAPAALLMGAGSEWKVREGRIVFVLATHRKGMDTKGCLETFLDAPRIVLPGGTFMSHEHLHKWEPPNRRLAGNRSILMCGAPQGKYHLLQSHEDRTAGARGRRQNLNGETEKLRGLLGGGLEQADQIQFIEGVKQLLGHLKETDGSKEQGEFLDMSFDLINQALRRNKISLATGLSVMIHEFDPKDKELFIARLAKRHAVYGEEPGDWWIDRLGGDRTAAWKEGMTIFKTKWPRETTEDDQRVQRAMEIFELYGRLLADGTQGPGMGLAPVVRQIIDDRLLVDTPPTHNDPDDQLLELHMHRQAHSYLDNWRALAVENLKEGDRVGYDNLIKDLKGKVGDTIPFLREFDIETPEELAQTIGRFGTVIMQSLRDHALEEFNSIVADTGPVWLKRVRIAELDGQDVTVGKQVSDAARKRQKKMEFRFGFYWPAVPEAGSPRHPSQFNDCIDTIDEVPILPKRKGFRKG